MSNSQNNKIDINELIKKASQQGVNGQTNEENVNDFIDKNLSDSQAKAVRELLADEAKTKALLNSDAAKAIFKKFFGGNGNA